MFEKPQYLTPDGFRRMKKNPYTKAAVPVKPAVKPQPAAPSTAKTLASKGKAPNSPATPAPSSARLLQKRKNRPAISEKAAKLIALAIKDMLKE